MNEKSTPISKPVVKTETAQPVKVRIGDSAQPWPAVKVRIGDSALPW